MDIESDSASLLHQIPSSPPSLTVSHLGYAAVRIRGCPVVITSVCS
jgi:hypothetical protein